MWVIVVFSNENSVECIPECWLTDNNSCYWPSYKGSRLKSAIALCEKPQDHWKIFHIRRINEDKVYDRLIQARNVCDRAQYTSDISDIDEVKRKPKKKIISSSSSEEDDASPTQHISIPSPPRIFNKPRDNFEKIGDSHKTSKGSNFAQPKDVPLQKKVTSTDPTGFDNKSFQEFQQQIIRKLNVINLKLDQMATDIDQLRSMIEEKPDNRRVCLENINFNLPLNSVEELENFEVELKTKERHAEFCAYLEKIGGNSDYENIKRIFGRVMTNELASQYNWLGLKKKKTFHTLQITNIAKDAVLKNHMLKNSTEKSIEFAIKNWLRHAKDRMKGTENHNEAH